MYMKISNETKVGALTAIAITLLILGFNFLKGKSFLKTGYFFYAKYPDAKNLMVSNPVFINGYRIGNVFEIENESNLKNIIVTIKLNKMYQVPNNSTAFVKENPLNTSSIEINLGDSKTMLNNGDTLNTINSESLLGSITNQLSPLSDQLKNTLTSLNAVLKNVSSIFDPSTKNNLQQIITNVEKTTENLQNTSIRLTALLDKENGSITQSLNNVNSFTKNLSDNNEKINATLSNIQTTSEKLSKADIEGAVAELKKAATELNSTIAKINSSQGSLGSLVNDKTLYNNLNNTVRSANILMDDLRTHPKRYVHISVFGRKDKTAPLTEPIDSIKH